MAAEGEWLAASVTPTLRGRCTGIVRLNDETYQEGVMDAVIERVSPGPTNPGESEEPNGTKRLHGPTGKKSENFAAISAATQRPLLPFLLPLHDVDFNHTS